MQIANSQYMLPEKIAFVDIETTGLRAFYDRIIEIAIHRVENNKISRSFHTLINPQSHLPPEITMITGITAGDLENAPTFRQIKDDVLEIMDGCVFAAHNVRFDYGFIKSEFQRLEYTFKTKHFCTVRLSRALYPQFKHHNLDSLIERFKFECENRHRAFDDARILFSFYEKILGEFPIEKIAKAINIGLKKPNVPIKLKTNLKDIPEKPGVYIFYGDNGTPLYVGKSINLYERVMSHFSADIHSPVEMKISQQIESLETITTAGELGALLLESELIKKMLPLYNKKSRIKHELIALKKQINKEGYETAQLMPISNPQFEYNTDKMDELSRLFGFFKSRKQAKSFLADAAKEYGLCEKLLGLEKTNGACFAYRLGRCRGACTGHEQAAAYNIRFLSAFAGFNIKPWPFPGMIAIEEADGNVKELILVDKWCLLGRIKLDTAGNSNAQILPNTYFDLDTYKIIKQYVYREQNLNKIRLLKGDEINALTGNSSVY